VGLGQHEGDALVLRRHESLVLRRLRPAPRVVALVLLFAPGLQAVLSASVGPQPRLDVLRRAEHDAVCRALAGIDTTHVATAQTFNHPVALCGRRLVAGYSGHLWSHGLNAGPVEARLKRLMLGEPGWLDEARALRASHLYWGWREAAAFPASARPWERQLPVASGPWGAIYKLE
jgi:hypothetical protein